MRCTEPAEVIKRTIYYLSRNYESQLGKGEDYSTISKTIAINILRFSYLDNEPHFHNTYRLKNVKNNNELNRYNGSAFYRAS